jgi:hypothetical protein
MGRVTRRPPVKRHRGRYLLEFCRGRYLLAEITAAAPVTPRLQAASAAANAQLVENPESVPLPWQLVPRSVYTQLTEESKQLQQQGKQIGSAAAACAKQERVRVTTAALLALLGQLRVHAPWHKLPWQRLALRTPQPTTDSIHQRVRALSRTPP